MSGMKGCEKLPETPPNDQLRPRSDSMTMSGAEFRRKQSELRLNTGLMPPRQGSLEPQIQRRGSILEPHLHQPVDEMFPGSMEIQDEEVEDRSWLNNRREARRKQDMEDLHLFHTRQEERKKRHYLELNNTSTPVDEPPIVSLTDREQFKMMVCIDKKKAKGHAHGLLLNAFRFADSHNLITLYNCFSKKTARREEETLQALQAIRSILLRTDKFPEDRVSVACEHVTDKSAAIISFANRNDVNIIVLGSRKEEKSFFRRSKSPKIIDSCPENKAVLIVPPPENQPELQENGLDYLLSNPNALKPRRILLCFDGTPQCERALFYLAHLMKPTDCLTICNVVTPPPKLLLVSQSDDRGTIKMNDRHEEELQQRLTHATMMLTKVKRRLVCTLKMDEGSIDIRREILEPKHQHTGETILEVARAIKADLVVQGSVTQPILETTNRRCVLIVR